MSDRPRTEQDIRPRIYYDDSGKGLAAWRVANPTANLGDIAIIKEPNAEGEAPFIGVATYWNGTSWSNIIIGA